MLWVLVFLWYATDTSASNYYISLYSADLTQKITESGPFDRLWVSESNVTLQVANCDKSISLYLNTDFVHNSCSKHTISAPGLHTVACYQHHNSGTTQEVAELIQLEHVKVTLPLGVSYMPAATRRTQVGVYYTPYQQTLAQWMQNATKGSGHSPPTITDVVGSNGKLQLSDILTPYLKYRHASWGINSADHPLMFAVKPELGFYCIYRKRPHEAGYMPDCVNITQTLQQQAEWMVAAGIDYIVFDQTNVPNWSPQTDVNGLRPTGVLLEEWAKLRKKGHRTPSVVVWNAIASGHDGNFTPGDMWYRFLELYNNPEFDDLILRDPTTGNKVFWVTTDQCGTACSQNLNKIVSNGGRNDITIVRNFCCWGTWGSDGQWGRVDPTPYRINGYWTYLSPCTYKNSKENDDLFYTTSIRYNRKCNHMRTDYSPLGSSWTVSYDYQSMSESTPQNSPTKLEGLTVMKQFEDVFENPSDWLFLPSWNEQTVNNNTIDERSGYTNTYITSAGLEFDKRPRTDFLDSYTSGRSRYIEPAVEDGGKWYNMFASCIRVMRLLQHIDKTSCANVKNEKCCTIDETMKFSSVWSLNYTKGATVQYVLSNDKQEVQALMKHGWTEMCVGIAGDSDFCFDWDVAATNTSRVLQTSFILSIGKVESADWKTLYRCKLSDGVQSTWFITTDHRCEGIGTIDQTLGLLSPKRSGSYARSLHQCKAEGQWFHTLDAPCSYVKSGSSDKVLGYLV